MWLVGGAFDHLCCWVFRILCFSSLPRQRALKALDERLSKSTQSNTIAWPSMEDTASSGEEQPHPIVQPHPTSGSSPSLGKPEAVAVEEDKSDHSVNSGSSTGQQGGGQMATTSSSSSLTKHDL